MLSAVTGEMIADGAKACVLAHRDELTVQNRAKFQLVVPGISTSVIDAAEKSWGGQVAFAMVPTLARTSNLADMPRLDLLVIDEAHHAVADSYRRIIDRVRDANPDARIFGVTATPNRGDKKGLREVFDNVADQVRLGELIASGHLVPPRTFVIDVGVQDELRSVRKTLSDFDMAEVAGIMDRAPVTDEVIRHWTEKAGDRQTVIFCSTVAHAEHVTEAFRAAGITAALIHGDLASDTRKAILADYAAGSIRVIVNVAVLTEGWDHPPTSCVVLLRPSSYSRGGERKDEKGLDRIARDWPTPMANDGCKPSAGNRRTADLTHASQMWMTPTARDYKDGATTLANTPVNGLLGRQVLVTPTPGSDASEPRRTLNPLFVEALMGWPTGWTGFASVATEWSPWLRRMRCELWRLNFWPMDEVGG